MCIQLYIHMYDTHFHYNTALHKVIQQVQQLWALQDHNKNNKINLKETSYVRI